MFSAEERMTSPKIIIRAHTEQEQQEQQKFKSKRKEILICWIGLNKILFEEMP